MFSLILSEGEEKVKDVVGSSSYCGDWWTVATEQRWRVRNVVNELIALGFLIDCRVFDISDAAISSIFSSVLAEFFFFFFVRVLTQILVTPFEPPSYRFRFLFSVFVFRFSFFNVSGLLTGLGFQDPRVGIL